jgi:hypothetical protein
MKKYFSIVFFLNLSIAFAQESMNASGGNAAGSGGTASYSVGQMVYTTEVANAGRKLGLEQAQRLELLKFEPKGTDDTIIYTLSLHNLLNSKNIPHLFMNMGKLDSDVLSARENWLQDIDPKNYLSVNDDDTILQKMSFCFTWIPLKFFKKR